MTRPRLLLVEDDASIRRFVAMALEDEAVDVVQAASLAQARQALQHGPYALVMFDLMLPDGNGLELLHELAQPQPAPGARRGWPSVPVSPRRCTSSCCRPGSFQVLKKPVALLDLLDCTRRALSWATSHVTPRSVTPAAPGGVSPGHAPDLAPAPEDASRPRTALPVTSAADVAAAVAHFFGGDFKLYVDFDRRCRQQFGADLTQGDRALHSADLAALRRLAHSLKSVLQSLAMSSQRTGRAAGNRCRTRAGPRISGPVGTVGGLVAAASQHLRSAPACPRAGRPHQAAFMRPTGRGSNPQGPAIWRNRACPLGDTAHFMKLPRLLQRPWFWLLALPLALATALLSVVLQGEPSVSTQANLDVADVQRALATAEGPRPAAPAPGAGAGGEPVSARA